MVHALEESWRILKAGGRLVDLRPTSPRWKVEVVSRDDATIAGEFDDPTRWREDDTSNQAIIKVLSQRLFSEESVGFFDFEYYWTSVAGMVEHVEYDWLAESTIPEQVVEETYRLMELAPGPAELRIKRKMILATYSKIVA